MEKKDFFISYNKADRQWAEWIAWELEEANYTTILQAWDFLSGQNFVLQMQEAATKCERTIAVLSPSYLVAEFTQPEWAAAFAQDPKGETGTLLPLRVAECDLEGLLSPIIYTDLFELSENQAREALLTAAAAKRKKPATAPSFPAPVKATAPTPTFPGALSRVWNVPHRRNPNFTGRGELLTKLREQLASGEFAALTQAISGLGGVGKTQLATEYAYRHAPDYDVVWWVRSEEPAQLASDYAGLRTAVSATGAGEADQKAEISAARSWLDGHGNWLLILDNVPSPGDVAEYLPSAGSGHVIITSQNPNWGGVASPLAVETWLREESVAFLLKRTRQTDAKAADALADALGDLPLALEQAAAYMVAAGQSLAAYTVTFAEHQKELLERGSGSQDYPDSVATTWEMALEQLEEEPAAVELLNLCAFLAPDDIPLGVIREGAEHLPKALAAAAADDLAWHDVLAALRRYSLLVVNGDALSLHRLVQAVVRQRLPVEETVTSAKAALKVVNDSFPGGSDYDVQTWPICARLAPHALAASGHAEGLNISPQVLGGLVHKLGAYFRGRVQLAEAQAAFERAIKIHEAALGPMHPQVATELNGLGTVRQALGDLSGARALYERALKIDEAVCGPEHPDVARDVNNLGCALRDEGDLAGARAHLERALKIEEIAHISDHPTVAFAVINLGSVLRLQGDFAKAQVHFERAIKIHEAAFGPDDPHVATALSHLGRVLQDQGDQAGAQSAHERELRIDEAAYGPDHPKIASCVSHLGHILRIQGDLDLSRSNFDRALRIDEAAYGPNHPQVATDLLNLGVVLRDEGDEAGARAHYERALGILRGFHGADHPETIYAQERLDALND